MIILNYYLSQTNMMIYNIFQKNVIKFIEAVNYQTVSTLFHVFF